MDDSPAGLLLVIVAGFVRAHKWNELKEFWIEYRKLRDMKRIVLTPRTIEDKPRP